MAAFDKVFKERLILGKILQYRNKHMEDLPKLNRYMRDGRSTV